MSIQDPDFTFVQERYTVVLQALQSAPQGMSLAEVRAKVNDASLVERVISMLKSRPNIAFDATTQIFRYQSASLVGSFEQLRAAIQKSERLVITHEQLDVLPPYEGFKEDIETLHARGEILKIVFGSKNKENWMLFEAPLNFSAVGPAPSSSTVLNWDNTSVVPKPDTYSQLRKDLLNMGQPIAQLQCNVPPQITKTVEKKKTVRAPRFRKRQVDDKTSISFIAKALHQALFSFGGSGIENGLHFNEDNLVDDDDDEGNENDRKEAERRAYFFLHHNRDAAPEEFDAVSNLAIFVGKWFYGDVGAILMRKFMEQKIQHGNELPAAIGPGIPAKTVTEVLAKMKQHQLIMEHTFDSKQQQGRSFSIWTCDLNTLVDAINYRLCSIRQYYIDVIPKWRSCVLECSSCGLKYTDAQVAILQRDGAGYLCMRDSKRLTPFNGKEAVLGSERALAEFLEFSRPLFDILRSILPKNPNASFSYASVPSTPLSVPGTPVPATPSTTLKRPGQASTVRRTGVPRSSVTPARTLPTPSKIEPPPTPAAPVEQEPEVVPEFDTTPLIFSIEHPRDVLLAAFEDPTKYADARAYHLAKTLLDDTAQFVEVIVRSQQVDAKGPGEETHLEARKYFQYRYSWESLYLALQRGYRPAEIVRLLEALSPSGCINSRLFALIMDEDKYKDHFGVVVQILVVQDAHSNWVNQHWLCSNNLDRMNSLMAITGIRHMVDTTYDSNFVARGGYQYCVMLTPHKQLGDQHTIESLKRFAASAGIHVIDEYDISQPSTTKLPGADKLILATGPNADRPLDIHLKDETKVREYQKAAVERIFWNPFKAHSGVLVLPCGAGKTLIGISVMAAIKRPTIIFCQSTLAVSQWRDQVKRFTNLTSPDIVRFASEYLNRENPNMDTAPVIVSTYTMFASSTGSNRSARSNSWMKQCQQRRWGLIILDEVHQAPAEVFRRVTNGFKAHIKLGLTATLVREDDRIDDLPLLVGPKLFELDIFTLRMQKHISVVKCHEIHCPMSSGYMALHDSTNSHDEKRLLFTTNLNKVRVCATLIKRHMSQGHKIMIFCDDLFGLRWYSMMLKKDMLEGETHLQYRQELIGRFRKAKNGDCLLFSKVGDQSIDLPEANVVIQIALMQGSRMQELQRIGRVQRPAPGKTGAWFYSLVSPRTAEVEFAARRRSYLEQNGYDVTVHTGEAGFAAFVDADSASLLPQDKMDALEQLMGKSIKTELANRSAKNKNARRKGQEADDHGSAVLNQIMTEFAQYGLEDPTAKNKKIIEEYNAKTGRGKRKERDELQIKQEIKPDPAATPSSASPSPQTPRRDEFAAPAPKRQKTTQSTTLLKWSKESKKK